MAPKRMFFYLIYGGAAFVAMLLLRFPGDQMVKTLSVEANRMGLTFTCSNSRQAFPLGVNCSQARLGLGRIMSFDPDRLALNLPISSLFASSKTIGISGTWRQGILKGSLQGIPFSPDPPASLFVSVAQASFEQLPYATDTFEVKTDFILDGELEAGSGKGPQNRQQMPGLMPQLMLRGRLDLSQVRCMIQTGALKDAGIDAFGFSTVHIEVSPGVRETIDVICKARGDLAAVDLEGTIQTENVSDMTMDIANLGLDLKGYLRPAPEHAPAFASIFPLASLFDTTSARGIPIRITGTIGAPRLVQ